MLPLNLTCSTAYILLAQRTKKEGGVFRTRCSAKVQGAENLYEELLQHRRIITASEKKAA